MEQKERGKLEGRKGAGANKTGVRYNFENIGTDAYLWPCVINALYDKANNSRSTSQTSL